MSDSPGYDDWSNEATSLANDVAASTQSLLSAWQGVKEKA